MKSLYAIDLRVVRGDRTVLSGLNFSIGPGEILHLVGRNGAGKTSLLEVLSGLRTPGGGTLVAQPGPDAQHWLGHRNGVHAALTPLENLRYWCRLINAPATDLSAALGRVGLYRLRHRPCGRLSTGQRRRAALARLFVTFRPWWFLDEPLAGLDAAGIDLVCTLVEEQARAGGAVVLSSHQALPRTLPGLSQRVLAP